MEKPTLSNHINYILTQKGAYSHPFLRDAIRVAREVSRWRDYYKVLDRNLEAIRFELGKVSAEHPHLHAKLEELADTLDELRRFPFTEKESENLLS